MPISTNLNELKAHIEKVHKELLKTDVFKDLAKIAGNEMKKNVISRLGSSGHDYNQSGAMLRVIRADMPDFNVNDRGTRAKIGFGDIDELNIETLRGPQRGTFADKDGEPITVKLRPERELPAWIIMEFGRKGDGVSKGAKIPAAFKVAYGGRDSSKQFLFGPSSSRHFKKGIYFMTSMPLGDKGITHPGIKAGQFFRNGLKDSKEEINTLMRFALIESMKELAGRYGGKVEV